VRGRDPRRASRRTADPHVWAGGDCARFRTSEEKLLRLDSVQNATDHARTIAAAITAGAAQAHEATPWFWTHQFGRLQIAGLTSGGDTAVVRGDLASGSFSVLAFSAGRLLGAESVNRPRDHAAVRRLLDRGVGLTPHEAADDTVPLDAPVLETHA
jgi:3-phenylpropionate/trans-cinnamate dioxygenase ferredoxin reductase subunit